ncbi:MAG: ABC transporter permease subunit, partial [Saprospiraceae bacterium]|nr:ABC transporter permease subunit [Saprospiraceae bacterium]
MNWLLIRGEVSRRTRVILGVAGILLVLLVWTLLTMGENPVYPPIILPSPLKVLAAFQDLYLDNNLVGNTARSLGLNLAGYVEAILISIPVGFAIGLFIPFRFAFLKQIEGIRYLPIVALMGLFIVWFGVGTSMKVHFLAVGIIIYLLPMMIVRIDEVNDVYVKTVYTIGATNWQTIKTVYFPSVLSRISDDIRVLTAISWTYIIVVEGGIASTGGIGSLIWRMGMRQGRMDKAFALLILIIIIGVIQDRLFVRLDRYLFPHKYQLRDAERASRMRKESLFTVIWTYASKTIGRVFLGLYLILFVIDVFGLMGEFRPL